MPFPHVETDFRDLRPALIITHRLLGPRANIFWAAMITSAENVRWLGDVLLVDDHRDFGLPIPSVVRTTKIAIFETRMASLVGRIANAKLAEDELQLAEHLGL